jgi:AcrR family transcriptional regulator
MARVPESHLAARRQSILAAATELFSKKGTTQATMADIAEAAGISPGAIYRYFPNKDALVRESLHSGAEETAERFRAASRSDCPRESFDKVARSAFAGIGRPENRTAHILNLEHVLGAARSSNGRNGRDDVERLRTIVTSVGEALERILTDSPATRDIDAHALGEAFVSAYYGAIVMHLRDSRMDVMASYDALVALLDAALAGGAREQAL